ncbi:MAG: cupin domain-containing protein [Pseudomonadota bacterium]
MAESKTVRGPIAIDSIPWGEAGEGVRFFMRYRVLSDTRSDGRKIGIAYEELPPGKQTVPFHYHLLEEEHIIGLDGEATLRFGDARYRIKAGDYVGFPAGQRAGHCLINEGDKPFRYIVIGDNDPNDICVYPDSNKISIRRFDRAILRNGERLDYWDGERAGEPVGR